MPTAACLMNNRPEAVSSAHWGDERKFASRVPEAVSSAHWRDISTCSAATFFEALLKLLATNAPIQAVQKNNRQHPASFPILANTIRTRFQRSEPARAEIGM